MALIRRLSNQQVAELVCDKLLPAVQKSQICMNVETLAPDKFNDVKFLAEIR